MAIVVGIFLHRLLPTVAIMLVLPVSLAIGILGVYFSGHNINVMTLGGLALALGTIVDAGIVVMENIVRHLRMGKSPLEAAHDGAEEVVLPVLASTLTTVIIFVPALFLSGMIGSLFQPLALAAALTVGASYVVAMTMVPAFCARFLAPHGAGSSAVPG